MGVTVGGVVTITSVVGGSVTGGDVLAGVDTAGASVVSVRTRVVLERPMVVDDDDELDVVGPGDPLLPFPRASTTTISTTAARMTSAVSARAHRGQPRNAHEPAGTTRPGPEATGGASGGGIVSAGPGTGGSRRVGSSRDGIGAVGSSSSSVIEGAA